MSNFSFLQKEWPELFEAAKSAEKNAIADTRICAFYCRYTLEKVTKWLYEHDDYLRKPYNDNLGALIHEQTFKDNLSPGLFERIRLIWDLGNKAVHTDGKVKPERAILALRNLHAFLDWFTSYYSEFPPSEKLEFNSDYIPKEHAEEITKKALLEHEEKLRLKDEEFAKKHQKNKEEIEALKSTISELKEQNTRKIETEKDYTEAETRLVYIDMMLEEAGWDLEAKNVKEYPVVGMPNETGTGYVDYVLWGDDGKPLAVVEAKKTTVDPKVGQHQAKLYADCLEEMTGQRPVIFYSNGYSTFIWDDHEYPPREVAGFYTRDELQLIILRRSSKVTLDKITINKSITERPYQEIAIKKVCEAFQSKKREALLVMATGTGKTRVSASLVDVLMKNNWIKKVLFLADRVALVKQAKNAFTEHVTHLSTVNLINDKEDIDTRIVFSTYPTMMNMIDDRKNGGEKRFGPGHFDLIIIDEAHRSIYLKYREIFRYFDSILLGLTATPKSEVDRNTYSMFGIEDNIPTYAYELDAAVNDGFLVPPKAVEVNLKFPREGIKYDELSEEEKDEYEAKFYNEESEELPEEIDSSALNSWLFNTDTVDKALNYLMQNGHKIKGGDKLGKTIIFAKNHKHADFIVDRFNKNYPHYKGDFTVLVDYSIKYSDDLIDKFKVAESEPTVCVSVDMLDTGIDVPEILNLVFLKPVKSKAKFWQMIGRGTRLCKDVFGPGDDKENFRIFDFCENFEFFDNFPKGVEPTVQESLSSRLFVNRVLMLPYLTENDSLRESITRLLQERIDALDLDSFIVRPRRKYVEKYTKQEAWEKLNNDDRDELIENLSMLVNEPDKDEYSKRFDNIIINYQLSILKSANPIDPEKTRNKNTIIKIAENLKNKTTIPLIKTKLDLLTAITSTSFWKDVDINLLEKVRIELRDIVQFIDKAEKKAVYTSFKDEITGEKKREDIVKPDSELKEYRERIETYIRENQQQTAIFKIKQNIPITIQDLHTLESILFEGDLGTKDDFVKAYGNDKPLSLFIRSLVGLNIDAVQKAFTAFLNISSLSSDQIKFLETIIKFFTEKGVMEPEELFNPPFTNIHSEGVFGLFQATTAQKIINTVKALNIVNN